MRCLNHGTFILPKTIVIPSEQEKYRIKLMQCLESWTSVQATISDKTGIIMFTLDSVYVACWYI